MVQKSLSTTRQNKREAKSIYLLFVFFNFHGFFEVSSIFRLIQIFSDIEIRFNFLQHLQKAKFLQLDIAHLRRTSRLKRAIIYRAQLRLTGHVSDV